MQFYDDTNKQGICQEVDELCDSTDTSYPRVSKTRRANSAYKKVVNWLINTDGFWEFDDTNKTDHPRGKGTLVEGQEDYTFASDYLQISEIDILDKDGITYRRIRPLDHMELGDQSPDEYFGLETNGSPKKGLPEYFDLVSDDSFRLYPAPSATYCTLANGIRIWFKRNPTAFTVASGTTADTTEPGFAVHHEILAYMIAVPYCMSYKKDRVALYEKVIGDTTPPTGLKKAIIDHYASRDKSRRNIITFEDINYR